MGSTQTSLSFTVMQVWPGLPAAMAGSVSAPAMIESMRADDRRAPIVLPAPAGVVVFCMMVFPSRLVPGMITRFAHAGYKGREVGKKDRGIFPGGGAAGVAGRPTRNAGAIIPLHPALAPQNRFASVSTSTMTGALSAIARSTAGASSSGRLTRIPMPPQVSAYRAKSGLSRSVAKFW